MNKVILMGNLCRDIDVKYTQENNIMVGTSAIAVQKNTKNKDGKYDSDFISLIFWGKTCEFASKYFKKGSKALAEGRIQTRSYDDKDGKKVYVTEVVVENIEFCGSKNVYNSEKTDTQAFDNVFQNTASSELDEKPF